MAFKKGTLIFTNEAWKPIEDISGHDKVLVRNFIGDAEFIQPFALKKSKHNGEIITIGAERWRFSVTPDHTIVYDRDDMPIGAHLNTVQAKDMVAHPKNRIYRKFKYLVPEDYKPEHIKIYNEFGKRWVTISNDDFFVLMAYTLCRGNIELRKNRKASLKLVLDNDKREDELVLLGDILDRIGVRWSLYTGDKWFVHVDSQNSLAYRLATRLGSTTRKSMYLPDKVIYNSSKQLSERLIESIINASKRAETPRGKEYQFVSVNERLIDSLILLGTLSGYGMSKKLIFKEGDFTGITEAKKNIYSLFITTPVKTYSPSFVEKADYSGDVYKIDLFEGQVYVKDTEGAPVWVNPA
jgi:hypothetical protein